MMRMSTRESRAAHDRLGDLFDIFPDLNPLHFARREQQRRSVSSAPEQWRCGRVLRRCDPVAKAPSTYVNTRSLRPAHSCRRRSVSLAYRSRIFGDPSHMLPRCLDHVAVNGARSRTHSRRSPILPRLTTRPRDAAGRADHPRYMQTDRFRRGSPPVCVRGEPGSSVPVRRDVVRIHGPTRSSLSLDGSMCFV